MGPRGLGAGAALLLLALSACGQQGGGVASSPGAGSTQEPQAGAQPWLTADGDTLVTCSGEPAFPVSRVAEGGLEVSSEDSAEIVAALAQMKDEFGIDAPWPLQEAEADEVQWMLLWQESVAGVDQIGILIAEPGTTEFDLGSDESASLEWTGDSWRASSWSGTCGARPVLPAGREWSQVALDDATSAPDGTDQSGTTDQGEMTASATIDLLVSEIQCTSGRDPEPYLAEPVVVETAEVVTVYWTSEAMTGTATCPGNPWVPRTIELEEPLGDRALLDGSTYPPQPVRTVEEIMTGPPVATSG